MNKKNWKNPLPGKLRKPANFDPFKLVHTYCEICQGPLQEDEGGKRSCLHCQWSEPIAVGDDY